MGFHVPVRYYTNVPVEANASTPARRLVFPHPIARIAVKPKLSCVSPRPRSERRSACPFQSRQPLPKQLLQFPVGLGSIPLELPAREPTRRAFPRRSASCVVLARRLGRVSWRYRRLGTRRRPCNHTKHSPEGLCRRRASRRTFTPMETVSSAFPSARKHWFFPGTLRLKLRRFPSISASFRLFPPISTTARERWCQPVSAGFRWFPPIFAGFASLACRSRPEGRSWPAWETDANARLAEALRTPLAFHLRPEGR
jgi:hypothetical protein